MKRVWVNGVEGAMLDPDDPGVLLGLTVFDTMRTYGQVPFRRAQHLDRLEASAERLGIPLPERALIEHEVGIGVASGHDLSVRYMLTAGGNRVMQVKPIDPARVGGRFRVARMDWTSPDWLPGAVKHGSRAAWEVASRALGVDEVILVDWAGHILEASRSNVVGVVDGVLVTPALDDRFLAGVTRQALLDAASRAGLPMDERPLPYASNFSELYLTSTLKEVAPIVEVDGQPGPGAGPLGQALHEAFRDLVASSMASPGAG